MADPGFPGQHSTTTTVKTSSTTVETTIRFDQSYIRTIPGLLKIAMMVTNFIGFLCIQCSGVFSYHTRGSYFSFVSMFAFWFTGVLLLLYLFHVIEKLYKIPWLKIEFIFDVIWVILYLIAASLAVSFGPEAYIAAGFSTAVRMRSGGRGLPLAAAGHVSASAVLPFALPPLLGCIVLTFFGFCAMVMYGFDAFLKFNANQRGELAQGERVINTQRTTVSSPTY